MSIDYSSGRRALRDGDGWRKSTRSSSTGNGDCVEARLAGGAFEIRDSKLGTESPRFSLTAGAFSGLLAGIRSGEVD